MTTWLLIIAFGVLVIVPCWKAVIAGILLESSPAKWELWEKKEHERRKKRDEILGKAVKYFLRAMDWIGDKLNKPRGGNDAGHPE